MYSPTLFGRCPGKLCKSLLHALCRRLKIPEEIYVMTMMMSRKALEDYGLVNLGTINWNLSPTLLIEHALARHEGQLADNGALATTTGVHTGRSPKDKYIVSNDEINAKIWWGENNH